MKQLATLMNSAAMKNVAIGLGVSVLVPIAMTVLAPVLKPLARSTLKVGILAYEKGRETVAEIAEVVDDLVAEVQEEMQEAREREAASMEPLAPVDEAAAESDVDR